MINANQYLIYLQDQQVHVYRSCRYCLQSNETHEHLQRKYSEISLMTWKKLIKYINDLMLRQFSQISISILSISSFEYLKIIKGFQCLFYDFLSRIIDNMKKYYQDLHDWTKFKDIYHSCRWFDRFKSIIEIIDNLNLFFKYRYQVLCYYNHQSFFKQFQ